MLDFVIGTMMGPMDAQEVAEGFVGLSCEYPKFIRNNVVTIQNMVRTEHSPDSPCADSSLCQLSTNFKNSLAFYNSPSKLTFVGGIQPSFRKAGFQIRISNFSNIFVNKTFTCVRKDP